MLLLWIRPRILSSQIFSSKHYIGPLSITPDGSTLYVSALSSGTVIPIDTATNTVGTSILSGFFPGKIFIVPNGQKAFIPIFYMDEVLVMDVATQTITNSIPLPSGSNPYGSSLLPNGTTLYVVNITQGSLSVIDVASETLTTTLSLSPPLPADSGPFWVVATPDSKTVYVINETNNLIVPVDTQTNTVGVPFDGVAGSFQDMVISPDPSSGSSLYCDCSISRYRGHLLMHLHLSLRLGQLSHMLGILAMALW